MNGDYNFHLVEPDHVSGLSIDEKFTLFHQANPHVYRKLREMALLLKKQGKTKYGAKSLVEIIRWEHAMSTKGDVQFALNNNYTALYARLLMANEPELEGFFETRKRPSKSRPPASSHTTITVNNGRFVIAKWAAIMGENEEKLRQVIQTHFKPGWRETLSGLRFSTPQRKEQTNSLFEELEQLTGE